MESFSNISFHRKAVEPIACFKAGFELAKQQYWLMFGIGAVGILIASVVPLGILMGPMMCGIYLSYFQLYRGQPVEFGTLFKGFDYFGQSLIATLIHILPILVVFVPGYLVFYIGFFLLMQSQGSNPDPAVMMSFLGIAGLFWLLMFLFIMVVSVLFTFAYPLIVDRGLTGVDAVKLSVKAALANFWRLLGLFLLNALVSFVGLLFCYIGALFVLPISFGALAMAYERVFGLSAAAAANVPPPPPTFN